MKLWMWWVASTAWALYFVLLGVTQFKKAWGSEGFLLAFLDIFTVGSRLETLLSGVGAWTVAAIPLYLTGLVHRFRRSRERVRLEREREKIDKRLSSLDREEAAKQRLNEEARHDASATDEEPPSTTQET